MVFSAKLVGLAFIVGSTCKNIFESFVFVFVMHPYDVGDRCVVDGVLVNNFQSFFWLTITTKLKHIFHWVLFLLFEVAG